ncbi:hypothetical protein F4859DRAFT_30559 [Xylaria cf. heliscus]|nr:hypothetical protein F4859DRAFT_30559 [Xylaria cf. heliscus]
MAEQGSLSLSHVYYRYRVPLPSIHIPVEVGELRVSDDIALILPCVRRTTRVPFWHLASGFCLSLCRSWAEMQSMRGLRRIIPSTSPRYAVLYCSGRSRTFTSSIIPYNIKQPPRASDIDGSRTTKPNHDDPSVPEDGDPAEPSHKARDLCDSVIATMAKLPHPAVVITTLDRTYNAQAAAGVPVEAMRHPIARGITVSSFTSLCIRPRPHVMFNMTLPSTMYEALVACKDFNVHVLTPDKHGARVASVFSRGNRLPVGETKNLKYAFDIDADLGVFVGLNDKGLSHVEIANRESWHEQYQDAKKSGLRALELSRKTGPVAKASEIAEPTRQVHHVPYLHYRGVVEVLHCRLARTIHPDLPNAGQNVVIIGEVVNATYPRKHKDDLDGVPIALGYADRKYRSIGGAIHPYETGDLENRP